MYVGTGQSALKYRSLYSTLPYMTTRVEPAILSKYNKFLTTYTFSFQWFEVAIFMKTLFCWIDFDLCGSPSSRWLIGCRGCRSIERLCRLLWLVHFKLTNDISSRHIPPGINILRVHKSTGTSDQTAILKYDETSNFPCLCNPGLGSSEWAKYGGQKQRPIIYWWTKQKWGIRLIKGSKCGIEWRSQFLFLRL